MAGFFGCIIDRGDTRAAAAWIGRMARAPTVVGPVTIVDGAPFGVFGSRDASLVTVADGDALALAGYVRRGRHALDASSLLLAWQREGERLLEELTGEFAF